MGQLPLGAPQHVNRIPKILSRFDGNTPYRNLMNSGRLQPLHHPRCRPKPMNTALSRTWFGMQIHTVSQFPVLRGSHNQKTDKDPILTVATDFL